MFRGLLGYLLEVLFRITAAAAAVFPSRFYDFMRVAGPLLGEGVIGLKGDT